MPKIERLDHVALIVSEVNKSLAWYTEIFGLQPVYVKEWWSETAKFIGAGGTMLALFQDDPVNKVDLNPRKDERHFAFRTDRASFEEYQKYFAEVGIDFEFADYGKTHSIYIYDPDGYRCEITTYEV